MKIWFLMRNIILIAGFISFAIGCQAQNETYSVPEKSSQNQEKPTANTVEQETDDETLASAEQQLDRFIEEFEKLTDTLVSGYKKLKPKLEKLGTIVQEKLQELEDQVQSDTDNEQ